MSLKAHSGYLGLKSFKIIGTNADLQRFEAECKSLHLEVSQANSYFRGDYEHCLMPAYAYSPDQPKNIKLQTMSADAYDTELVYDLKADYKTALSMVEVTNDLFL